MDHLAGYGTGTDSEGEDAEQGGSAEPIQQRESPEKEEERGEKLRDAFDMGMDGAASGIHLASYRRNMVIF